MKIANIISDNKLDLLEEFNQIKLIEESIPGIPTLIIGWDKVKKKYPDYDILNRKISDNLYWTFKKIEKRDLHEEDLFFFIKNTYLNLIKDIDYIFIDPIQLSKKSLLKIIRKILNENKIISFKNEKMVYIYCDKYIFGVDLKLINFIGYDAEKIERKIIKKSNVFLSNNNIFIEYKIRLEMIDNQIRYIPYLYSIKNE
jgi:hypothetical protein